MMLIINKYLLQATTIKKGYLQIKLDIYQVDFVNMLPKPTTYNHYIYVIS